MGSLAFGMSAAGRRWAPCGALWDPGGTQARLGRVWLLPSELPYSSASVHLAKAVRMSRGGGPGAQASLGVLAGPVCPSGAVG